MSTDASALRTFLNDPANFDEIASDYQDEVECYIKLRDKAKKALSTFDEYIQFYGMAIEEGPSGFVLQDLNRNATRSLKNMILRSSSTGKRYPITSVTELERRAEAFHELGVNSVTPQSVVFTVLEFIFDDGNPNGYEVIDHLLSERSDASSDFVALFVRARFIIAVESLNANSPAVDIYTEEFYQDLPDTIPDDERSASELIDASRKKSYRNTEKIELIRGSLARQPGEEALSEYLYLSARDVVERYRHQSRKDPWRGELQLALRQFNSIENIYSENWSDERATRSRSYRQLVLAELASGGRWRSLRDPNDLPEPNFLSAANRYSRTSHEIKMVDIHRSIKYLGRVPNSSSVASSLKC